MDAEASFRMALSLAPNDAEVWSILGLTLAQQGQYSEAKASFEAALALAPDFALARQALQQLPADA